MATPVFRFMDAANAVSLCGLAAAVACALYAAAGDVSRAVAALIVAGLCDLFDGLVARKLDRDDEQRTFGGRLDSVVDACAFGLAPTVLLYAAGMQNIGEIIVLVVFAVAAVWRLAYFDTVGMETEGDRRYYVGLPTTYVALALPLALLAGHFGADAQRASANVASAALAVAMVSEVRIPKPTGVWYAVFPVMAIALLAYYLTAFPR